MAASKISSLAAGNDILINQRVSGVNTPIYPVTKTANVKNAAGKSVDTLIAEINAKNFVPDFSSETASAIRFLANDNTWKTIQSASTSQAGIVQLSSAVDSESESQAATSKAVKLVQDAVDTLDGDVVKTSQLGQATAGDVVGVATLDNAGKVPSSQLPSYVDDVIEGYYDATANKFYTTAEKTTEIAGESGKIYVDLTTGAGNKVFRWAGEASGFIVISDNSGAIADHLADTNNPHSVTYTQVGAVAYTTDAQGLTTAQQTNAKTNIGLENVGNFLAVSTDASQGLTDTQKTNAKTNIGLENVGNFKAVSTVASQGLTETEQTNAKTNIGLENVGNFKAVSTVASQGLTSTEQANARANIGVDISGYSNLAVSEDAPAWTDGVWMQIVEVEEPTA